MIVLIGGIYKRKRGQVTNEHVYKTSRVTDVENLMVTRV